MLYIVKRPACGDVPDRFNEETQQILREGGIDTHIREMWPNRLFHFFVQVGFPCSRRIFDRLVIPFSLWRCLRGVSKGDWVWVNGYTRLLPDLKCAFELSIKKRGAKYFLWLEDDMFSVKGIEESISKRTELADAIGVVTPQLKQRLFKLYPEKIIVLLEEPIDLKRVGEVTQKDGQEIPMIAWTGRLNIYRVPEMFAMLSKVYEQVPFKLLLVCGDKRPAIVCPFPLEWRPYGEDNESSSFEGAVVGMATLEKTSYDECKGNYKVKTYMAMGLCPVVTKFGYNNDLIRHLDTGFLVDSKEEWIGVLVELLRNPRRAVEIGAKARANVNDRFSHANVIPEWVEQLKTSVFCIDGSFIDT